jgi:hypothetical protein
MNETMTTSEKEFDYIMNKYKNTYDMDWNIDEIPSIFTPLNSIELFKS